MNIKLGPLKMAPKISAFNNHNKMLRIFIENYEIGSKGCLIFTESETEKLRAALNKGE